MLTIQLLSISAQHGFLAYLGAPTAFNAGDTITFNIIKYNPSGNYEIPTATYTVAMTGYYLINIQLFSTNGFADYGLYINDAHVTRSRTQVAGEYAEQVANGMLILPLNVGDTLKVQASHYTQTLYGYTDYPYTYFQVMPLYPA